MRSCREAKAAVAARAASHRFAFMTLSGFDSDHTLVHSSFFTPRETAATSVLTPRSEPVDSAIPAAAPASDLDHMADIPTAGSHSPHQVSLLAVDSGGAMAENESGGTGGGGYSSCGAGLPDSADVGRGPERPVSSAAIMAHLTALSKQMEAIQQAIQQQQQASGYLARPGASTFLWGFASCTHLQRKERRATRPCPWRSSSPSTEFTVFRRARWLAKSAAGTGHHLAAPLRPHR
jgi:hypothetical protein